MATNCVISYFLFNILVLAFIWINIPSYTIPQPSCTDWLYVGKSCCTDGPSVSINICRHHTSVVVSGIGIKFCRWTQFYRLIVRGSTLCELKKIKAMYKCHIELRWFISHESFIHQRHNCMPIDLWSNLSKYNKRNLVSQ